MLRSHVLLHRIAILLVLLLGLAACTPQQPPVTTTPGSQTLNNASVTAAGVATRSVATATPTSVVLTGSSPTAAPSPSPASPTPSPTLTPPATTPTAVASPATPTPSGPVQASFTSPSGYELNPPAGWETAEQKFKTIWYKPGSNKSIAIQVAKSEHVDKDAGSAIKDALEASAKQGDISSLQTKSEPTMLGGVEATRLESSFTRKSDNAKIAQIEIGAKRDDNLFVVRLTAPQDQISGVTNALDEVLNSFSFGPPMTANIIAFIRDGAVWLYRSDSLRLWPITDGSTVIRYVGWSNTGEQLFYIPQNGDRLMVMDADGGNPHVLIQAKDLGDPDPYTRFVSATWSPLGDRLLLIVATTVPIWVYTIKEDGSDPVRIGLAFDAVWDPQGKRIAYRNSRSDVGPINLFVADQDGKNVRNLTQPEPAYITGLAWGKQGIAFLNMSIPTDTGIGRDALELINPDGSNRHILMKLPAKVGSIDLAWLGDTTLSFIHDPSDSNTGTLQVVDLSAPNIQARNVITMVNQPSWSVDGNRVAFIRIGGGPNLFIANAHDGSSLRQLTYQQQNSSPTWSPQTTGNLPPSGGTLPAIVVQEPQSGATIHSPVTVSGTASVFEGTVQIRVRDAAGNIIGKATTTATAGGPARGTFSKAVSYTQPASNQAGKIEVYEIDAQDGSERNLVTIPVTLAAH